MTLPTSKDEAVPQSRLGRLSWVFLALYLLWIFFLKAALAHILSPVAANFTEQLLLTGFFLAHALGYYGGRAVVVYIAASLIISNLFENLSVLYGFPFGYYHHTSLAGPKLFNVPIAVSLIYMALGYVAWMVSEVLLSRTSRRSWGRLVYVAPLVAGFVFTGWDLCIDPIYGTIYQAFIYQNPGHWFGTPPGNYFGWMLTTYIFYLLFALYLRGRGQAADPAHSRPGAAYWVQPVLIYLAIAIGILLSNSRGPAVDITLANGKVWNTGDIFGASSLVTIFTMGFTTLLAFIALYQQFQRTTADAP